MSPGEQQHARNLRKHHRGLYGRGHHRRRRWRRTGYRRGFARQATTWITFRDPGRLECAALQVRRHGVRALAISTDVANADQVEAAASRIEAELGPIDVWVNVAMATVFAPVSKFTAAEVERGTRVTYGQVHGMMSALKRMRVRNRGVIVNVGSALAYRSVPLQSIYCGAKAAIRGFTDSLRSEIIHDKLNIQLTMVDLPAVNTPSSTGRSTRWGGRPSPSRPSSNPRSPRARSSMPRRIRQELIWVGWPTVKAILANRVAPGLIDRYLATAGYTGQLTDKPTSRDAPANLFEAVPGDYSAHRAVRRRRAQGEFRDDPRQAQKLAFLALASIAIGVILHQIAKRAKRIDI